MIRTGVVKIELIWTGFTNDKPFMFSKTGNWIVSPSTTNDLSSKLFPGVQFRDDLMKNEVSRQTKVHDWHWSSVLLPHLCYFGGDELHHWKDNYANFLMSGNQAILHQTTAIKKLMKANVMQRNKPVNEMPLTAASTEGLRLTESLSHGKKKNIRLLCFGCFAWLIFIRLF